MPVIKVYFIILLLFNALSNIQKNKSLFISPLNIPLSLSANFGELRIDHYHSGLDIKTQGVTGKEVFATADGYVFRFMVSPGGFGKAVEIRHPSGYSTLYGHLDRFAPKMEKYVIEQQYEKKSFLIAVFPLKEEFPVKQGELIAYSGNTGGSTGPHLHYEIRYAENEVPINPLLFNFGIEDNIKPVIEKLAVYPESPHTLINNQHKELKINVLGNPGNYYLPLENKIQISGPAGFGIKSYDLLNNNPGSFAVYTIELAIDSNIIFKYEMNNFAFAESRYINSHIDYENFIKDNIFYERAFILPNDKFSAYKKVVNNGIFNFNDDKEHHAEITVTDVQNNKTSLHFSVRSISEKAAVIPEKKDLNLKIMPFNRSNKFTSEDIILTIPAGALYDTLYFDYRKSEGNKTMLSEIHHIHNKYTPVHKPYSLSIKPTRIPPGKESKLIIAQIDDEMKLTAAGGTWKEGYVSADVSSFGNFAVGIDTIAPVISANSLLPGANLTGKTELRILITDDFSGIKSYEPAIDNKWALFEYDQKNNMLIYRFDSQRITIGSKHNLALKVTDNCNNSSFYNCEFIW